MILANYGTKLLLILRWLLTSKFPKRLWVVEAGALLLSMDVRSFELELFENPLNRTEWSYTCQKCMKIDDSLFLIITVNGYHLDMWHMTNECKWQTFPLWGVHGCRWRAWSGIVTANSLREFCSSLSSQN